MSDHQDDLLLNSGSGNPAGFERIYECQYCPKSFKSTKNLHRHKKFHNILRAFFKCRYCHKSYRNRARARAHLWSHFEHQKEVECPIKDCCLKFEGLKNVEIHLDQHHEVSPFQCKLCDEKFENAFGMGTTIVRPRIEPKPTEFVCPVEFCDQKFDNFIELKNHLDELHGMSYRISSKCKMCHLKYEKSYLMICHFLIEHKNVSGTEIAEQEIPEQKPSLEDIKLEIPDSPIDLETKCPQCEIDFNDVKMYLIHKTTHSQFHPFECAFCGQESGNKYDFMSHFYSNHSI
ncbi:hypothetical protein L3Y34_019188 [Caenorhabditis briggsae]|uniref:C2H2-type domain-containing protein n=1 Tax=Caenorhabditis briggsae TaxID=6238 RepID=A0AAE9DM96_CAEBR|nr:hypothetical protein L3Y34_019188 [Caenorhabditis briggsae]